MTVPVFPRFFEWRSVSTGLMTVLALAISGSSALALDNPEVTWSHKDWRAGYEGGRCAIWTGGDGAGTFEISFETGGYNGSASYLPIVYSNYPLPLREDDEYELIVNNRASGFGSELWFYDGMDGYNRYMVGATLTGGFVPDLIATFRRSDTLAIQIWPTGKAPYIADDFSLSGFTATYLKISEWCAFDPDNLFQS